MLLHEAVVLHAGGGIVLHHGLDVFDVLLGVAVQLLRRGVYARILLVEVGGAAHIDVLSHEGEVCGDISLLGHGPLLKGDIVMGLDTFQHGLIEGRTVLEVVIQQPFPEGGGLVGALGEGLAVLLGSEDELFAQRILHVVGILAEVGIAADHLTHRKGKAVDGDLSAHAVIHRGDSLFNDHDLPLAHRHVHMGGVDDGHIEVTLHQVASQREAVQIDAQLP